MATCRDCLMLYNRNDTYIGASLRKYGEFSREETALFQLIVQPGRTVLDIGANIGVHTIDMSRLVGPVPGRCNAFEPQRLVFQVLCANLALNSCANVFARTTWQVGAENGTVLVPPLDPALSITTMADCRYLTQQPGEQVPAADHRRIACDSRTASSSSSTSRAWKPRRCAAPLHDDRPVSADLVCRE